MARAHQAAAEVVELPRRRASLHSRRESFANDGAGERGHVNAGDCAVLLHVDVHRRRRRHLGEGARLGVVLHIRRRNRRSLVAMQAERRGLSEACRLRCGLLLLLLLLLLEILHARLKLAAQASREMLCQRSDAREHVTQGRNRGTGRRLLG